MSFDKNRCRRGLHYVDRVRTRFHTGTPSGRFFFHVMASLAEMERELTIERTRAGLEVARKLGRKGGRKRQMTDNKIKSAKSYLRAEYRPAMWPATSAFLCQPCTGGFLLPPWPNVRYGPFSEGGPFLTIMSMSTSVPALTEDCGVEMLIANCLLTIGQQRASAEQRNNNDLDSCNHLNSFARRNNLWSALKRGSPCGISRGSTARLN